jgi:tripartite-type tricarboxylate transporter receptor subunit TctC
MARRALSAGLLLAAAVACSTSVRAADWPTKPVRIVVSFAAGGAADIWARIIAEPLSAALKQSVVIENRGGGGGLVAAQQVARAEPDGHTILMGGLASQILAPSIADNPGFDGLRDFSHIVYIGGPPITWVVPPSSELRSVSDLIAAAKADKFSGYASSGVGTVGHLVVEYVANRNGLKLTHIPYNTAAFADIIGGRVPMGSFTWGAALGQVQGGTLRALAVTTETRRPALSNVPTFKELGYDLVASTWFSFSGPKGMPKEIVQRLNQETLRILDRPEIRKRVEEDAFDPKPLKPEQVEAFFAAETERWTPIAQAAMKKQ